MTVITAIILIILTFIQSIFGVGLLIFGTPTFMLMGYSYSETLSILLPISCSVSLIQITTSKKSNIDKFLKNFCKFSLPAVILSLPFALLYISKNNINLIISLIMIIISLLSIANSKYILKLIYPPFNLKVSLIISGYAHGLTNLGGGFISIISSMLYVKDKIQIRYAIAAAYLIFGLTQISILIFLNNFFLNEIFLFFVLLTPLIFCFSVFVFKQISINNFSKYIYVIVLVYGLIIFFKNIIIVF